MSDFVSARLNYYQVLGVSPGAAGDEIDRAFAREGSVFRPHAFGGLTELCMAYETLRDPASRRAYDATLRGQREAIPLNRSIGARPVSAQPLSMGSANAEVPAKAPSSTTHSVSPPPKPALALGPGAELHAQSEPRFSQALTPSPSVEDYLGVEARPLDLKRTGIVLGAIIGAACMAGGAAGWWSTRSIDEPQETEGKATVSLSPAKPALAFTAEQAEPVPVQVAAPIERVARPKPKAAIPPPVEPMAAAPQSIAVEQQPEQIAADADLVTQAEVETPASEAVAAAMPLPNRTIARTIDRIGYACGAVSSTASVEGGSPGTFKVNCTSGQSFQASPVNGRYRFRRWDKR
ncbi:hypothetical protein LZ496_10720 [Sphingomonas sp. NSE70-1]|uniref:J domain-containing protein n=1 Tax=Sphingomonas caseinilyticus TaxID=2908205 RepID=A0ABT0RWB8_9SPHN|nr:hypothetical protein [Sphingomonas caseinilyticus]MCL6699251.1 hypothetical protein [Sphingomonas caseinilyticus]